MKAPLFLVVGLAVLAGNISEGVAKEPRPKGARTAGGTTYAKAASHRRRPLEVTVYGRRRVGGYSYARPDVTGTYGSSPPPYLDVRQSEAGPFDSGFFFDSGMGPRGGNSPYMR